MAQDAGDWSPEDSSDLFEVPRWSQGYFSVGENGCVFAHPRRMSDEKMDLKGLVDRLQQSGWRPPFTIRFDDLLNDRVERIHEAFDHAIGEYGFRGQYTCVYPIKVNQQRYVVEQLVTGRGRSRLGLEAGSKAELLAVIALAQPGMPIICNGFKDADFVEIALHAERIGKRVYVVVEKAAELDLVLRVADRQRIRPRIGVRIRLASRGAGRWKDSAGLRSKFGLSTTEVLQTLRRLKDEGRADCMELLHFHLGSQVTDIRVIKNAITEAARVYADLVKLGAGLTCLDVGGGLGVDYDGSQTDHQSSMNYTLQEYANDVVFHVQTVCDENGVEHPELLSESGRAVAAYHSVLVFAVDEDKGPPDSPSVKEGAPPERSGPLRDLHDALMELTAANPLETFHDAVAAYETAQTLFSTGHLSLQGRAAAESLFGRICQRVRDVVDSLAFVPDELLELECLLAKTYYGNFSVFHSLPDRWAIEQLFPIMPLHRLEERPTQLAVLADMTCDSDGRIDQFVGHRTHRKTLPHHARDDQPYYLGVFLVGAYQETLGETHNLFGNTNVVHIGLDAEGRPCIKRVIPGDDVAAILADLGYAEADLEQRLAGTIETAVRESRVDAEEAEDCRQSFRRVLAADTYLNPGLEPYTTPNRPHFYVAPPALRPDAGRPK